MKNGKQPILDNQFEDNKGLTKREYFAGLAMQGMAMSDLKFEDMARDAVKMADALLAELACLDKLIAILETKQQEQ
jgi:hypothetical protein